MIHRLTHIIFLVFIVSPAYSMTVDEAVYHALGNNTEILALRLEQDIARGQNEKARLLLSNNPTIEGSISKKDRLPEEGGGKFTNYGVKLSQEIEIAGQRSLRIGVSENEISRVSFELEDKERVLTAEVKDNFAKVLFQKKRKELAGDVVRLQEDLLAFTKIKFQAGETSGLDVNLAEVEMSKAKKELLSAEREYREALLTLLGLIGMKSDTSTGIVGDLPEDAPAFPDKEHLKNVFFLQRPDIKASSFEIEKTESALSLVRREAFPNITLSGFYIRDEQRNEIGLELSIPLPFFDRKQAEKKEARARWEQAKIRAEGLRKTAEGDFEQAYGDLSTASEELGIYKKEIMTRVTENLGLLNLAYKEGKIGFFEVRLAQKETIETQFAYLEARLKAQLALNAIEKNTGGAVR